MRRLLAWSVFLIPFLAGCGGLDSPSTNRTVQPTGRGTGNTGPGATGAHAAPVSATEIKYEGWSALKLANDSVTVVAVPDIGGRIMEYKLGNHPLLWINPDERGKLYDAPKTEAERTWHNYGGYKVWPAPQDDWKGPPDPLGSALDGGRWKGQLGARTPTAGSLTLTSPADKAVTGLQITRDVTLNAGTTKLTIKETFTNVSDKPITWSIWDVTQVPGALDGKQKYSDKARIYFPLNPQSKFPNGFHEIVEGGGDEWMPNVAPGIMGVKYEMKQGKIGADSAAGWVAYVDELHDYALVKRFNAEKIGEYPDKGSMVEVWCSGELPYMEVEVLGPLTRIEPGKTITRTEDWYACRSGGPIIGCSDVGVTQQPLKLDRQHDKTELTGRFGVFLPGTVEIAFQDERDREISVARSLPADPDKVFELKQPITIPQDARSIVLRVVNQAGTPVGVLASVAVETP